MFTDTLDILAEDLRDEIFATLEGTFTSREMSGPEAMRIALVLEKTLRILLADHFGETLSIAASQPSSLDNHRSAKP